jgi:hypothetical protein
MRIIMIRVMHRDPTCSFPSRFGSKERVTLFSRARTPPDTSVLFGTDGGKGSKATNAVTQLASGISWMTSSCTPQRGFLALEPSVGNLSTQSVSSSVASIWVADQLLLQNKKQSAGDLSLVLQVRLPFRGIGSKQHLY